MGSALLDLKIGKCLVNSFMGSKGYGLRASGYQQLYAFLASAASFLFVVLLI